MPKMSGRRHFPPLPFPSCYDTTKIQFISFG